MSGTDASYQTEALIAEDIEAYLDLHQHKSMLRFITCGEPFTSSMKQFVRRASLFGAEPSLTVRRSLALRRDTLDPSDGIQIPLDACVNLA